MPQRPLTHAPQSAPELQIDRNGRLSPRLIAITLFSLLGVGVSSYLTVVHLRGGQYFCAGLGNCDYVNTSPYAELAGVPVALLGTVAYLAFIATALASWRGAGVLALVVAPLATFGIALGGLLFSAYLSYVEVFILHVICPWCVASALLVTMIFALSLPPLLVNSRE